MANQSGTANSVTLLSGNVDGIGARKSYLVGMSFPIAGGSDTASTTGVLTAINAAVRDGKTRTLRGGITVGAGYDASVAVYFTGTAVQALAVANPTTTGDLSGQLSDKTGTVQASNATTIDVQVAVVVDEA